MDYNGKSHSKGWFRGTPICAFFMGSNWQVFGPSDRWPASVFFVGRFSSRFSARIEDGSKTRWSIWVSKRVSFRIRWIRERFWFRLKSIDFLLKSIENPSKSTEICWLVVPKFLLSSSKFTWRPCQSSGSCWKIFPWKKWVIKSGSNFFFLPEGTIFLDHKGWSSPRDLPNLGILQATSSRCACDVYIIIYSYIYTYILYTYIYI